MQKYVHEKFALAHNRKRFKNFPNAVVACDVVLIYINKPSQNQKSSYSVKHKAHGVKLQALVNPDGICVDFIVGWQGSVRDKKVFDESNFQLKDSLVKLHYQM